MTSSLNIFLSTCHILHISAYPSHRSGCIVGVVVIQILVGFCSNGTIAASIHYMTSTVHGAVAAGLLHPKGKANELLSEKVAHIFKDIFFLSSIPY